MMSVLPCAAGHAARRVPVALLCCLLTTAAWSQLNIQVGAGASLNRVPHDYPRAVRHDSEWNPGRAALEASVGVGFGPRFELGVAGAIRSLDQRFTVDAPAGSTSEVNRHAQTAYLQLGPRVVYRLLPGIFADAGLGFAVATGQSGSGSTYEAATRTEVIAFTEFDEFRSYGFGEAGIQLRARRTYVRLGYHQGLQPAFVSASPYTDANGEALAPRGGGALQSLTLSAGLRLRLPRRPDEPTWSDALATRYTASALGRAGLVPVVDVQFPLHGTSLVPQFGLRLLRTGAGGRMRYGVGLRHLQHRVSLIDTTITVSFAGGRNFGTSHSYHQFRFEQLALPVSADIEFARGLRLGGEIAPILHLGTRVEQPWTRDEVESPPSPARLRLEAGLVGTWRARRKTEYFVATHRRLTPALSDSYPSTRGTFIGLRPARYTITFGVRFKLLDPRAAAASGATDVRNG